MNNLPKRSVEVYHKSVYGNDLIYPANTDAIRFAQLLGKKTLSVYDLQHIRELGFEVKQVLPESGVSL